MMFMQATLFPFVADAQVMAPAPMAVSVLPVSPLSPMPMLSAPVLASTDVYPVANLSGGWQETLQQVYATDNNAVTTTTATQRSRLSGFAGGVVEESVAIDINGNTTTAQTTINRAAKTQTRTVDEPDSTINSVTTTVNGLLTSEQNKTGVVTTYSYDALERLTGVTDPRTGTSTTSYNPATGRVDYVEDPTTNRVSYTYDSATGRKATETNALSQVTRYAYNTLDQITHTWGDVPYPVEYVYDAYGRLSRMRTWRASAAWNGATWPSGVAGQEDETTWNYQEATGLLTSKVDDAGQPTAYTYTTGGKLATRTWARSGGTIVTTYSYDPNTAELLSVNYSDTTPDVTFVYNRLGQQSTITDGLGSRTFSYNTALQPSAETVSGLYSKILTRTYATNGVVGRSTGLNTGADYSLTYGYDPTGRFNSVGWTVNGTTGNAIYTYVPNSDLLATLTTGSGQLTAYTYEPNRNLRTRVNNQFNAGTVSQYDYVSDGIGRRTSVANSGSAFSAAAFNRFNYNLRSELAESARYLGTDINNLTQPVTPEYRGFNYDPIGNRTNITVAASSGSYTANNLNQYSLANLPGGGSNTFTHDPDGNLTQISGSRNVTYTYDAENRLITAAPTTPAVNDKKVDAVYDYQGRRVRKLVSNWNGSGWVPETTKYFVYDGWNIVEEQTVSQPSKYYVWGLDLSQSLQGAGGIGGLLARVESTTTHNFLHDGNGNVTQLINATTGTTAAHYEYDPYGNTIVATGSAAANPYRFSTKYLDGETGLYYYGYRNYDPETGRFNTKDPKEEYGGINLYGLVGNDPIGLIDPLGLDFIAVGIRPAKVALKLQNHMSIEFYQEKSKCTKKGQKFSLSDVGKGILKDAKLTDQFELIPTFNSYERLHSIIIRGRTIDLPSTPVGISFIHRTSTAEDIVVVYDDSSNDASKKWSVIELKALNYKFAEQLPIGNALKKWPNSKYQLPPGNNSNTFVHEMASFIGASASVFNHAPGAKKAKTIIDNGVVPVPKSTP